jgi:hypothetical protein
LNEAIKSVQNFQYHRGICPFSEENMTENHAEQMLARFGPLDGLLNGLIKSGTVQELIAQPPPIFEVAMERVRRAHLEANGYKFLDPSMPGCESCEG